MPPIAVYTLSLLRVNLSYCYGNDEGKSNDMHDLDSDSTSCPLLALCLRINAILTEMWKTQMGIKSYNLFVLKVAIYQSCLLDAVISSFCPVPIIKHQLTNPFISLIDVDSSITCGYLSFLFLSTFSVTSCQKIIRLIIVFYPGVFVHLVK